MCAFIDCNRGRYTVGMMAKLLGVSPRSYYDFKKGIHPRREQNRLLPAAQMELEIFEYIEIWDNKARRHAALKNMTIDEFWKLNKFVA